MLDFLDLFGPKGVRQDVLRKAVQDALLSAAQKTVGPMRELRAHVDPKTGDTKAFAKLFVVERVVSRHDQISLTDARRISPNVNIGDEVEVDVTPSGFKRDASKEAKAALLQAIRQMELKP